LIKLAATCRWLWWQVSDQKQTWWYHFHAKYPEEDDKQMEWLRWFIARTAAKIEDEITTLSPYALDWFQAYRWRCAAEMRWFKKDEQYQLVSESTTTALPSECQVLQRILVQRISLGDCAYFEQCQSLINRAEQPTWHLRRLYCLGVNPDTEVWQIRLSSSFIVASVRSSHRHYLTGEFYSADILVWPVGQAHWIEPYQIPGLWSKSFDLRGQWLMVTDTQEMSTSNQASLTRIYNLHTRKWCIGSIEGQNVSAFFQRADQETAIVFHMDIGVDKMQEWPRLTWSVWRFDVYSSPKDSQCLAIGHCYLPRLNSSVMPIQRISDTQAFIGMSGISVASILARRQSKLGEKSDDEQDEHAVPEPITLGILDNVGHDDTLTETVELMPVWSQLVETKEFVPLIASQQLLLLSTKVWTILDLKTGGLIRTIEMETLDTWFSSFYWRTIKQRALKDGGLTSSRMVNRTPEGKLAVVDLLYPERIRELEIPKSLAGNNKPILCGGSANALIVKLGDRFGIVDTTQ
jgi:hypothetical protein